MGYVNRNQGFGQDLEDWEIAVIMGDGPNFVPQCLEIRRHHVISFHNDPHFFCDGQVESWRRQTAKITGACRNDECEGIESTDWVVYEQPFSANPLAPVDVVPHICDVCNENSGRGWPKPRRIGGVIINPFNEVFVKYNRVDVEKICLRTPEQVKAATRSLKGMNFKENLDLDCRSPFNGAMDLVTKIGDCLCKGDGLNNSLCNQLGGREKVDAFLDELIACTNQIMLPSVPARTEKEKEAEWEACVRAATDALCQQAPPY